MASHETSIPSTETAYPQAPNDINPSLAIYKLAKKLARARDAAGLKQQDIANSLCCSAAKVTRIENGRVRLTQTDLEAFLRTAGVADADKLPFQALREQQNARAWWSEYQTIVAEQDGLAMHIESEASARWLRIANCSYMPPLLQTKNYAYEWAAGFTGKLNQRLFADLTIRRQRLFEREDPPQVDIILGEGILHHQTGGKTAQAAQLDSLQAHIEQDNPKLSIGIIPFERGAYPGMCAPFVINDFGNSDVITTWEMGSGELQTCESSYIAHDKSNAADIFDNLGTVAVYGQTAIELVESARSKLLA